VRRALFLVSVFVTVLAVAMSASAASTTTTTKPQAFAIQGKVLQVGPGWMQVQVVKVQQGSGLRANAKLRIQQTAKTRFLRTGKAASARDLRAGETVQINGSIVRSGTRLTYQAGSITILR